MIDNHAFTPLQKKHYCILTEMTSTKDSISELKQAEQNHLHWLDISKGIGIFLVIIDHSLGPFNQQISYFHMPLFFMIAGITFMKKGFVKFLIGKINRIMIPWIFWSIISAILSLIPHGYGGPFNGPLWFLQNIFVALIIVYLTTILDRKYLKYAFICILLISFVTINTPELSYVLPFGLPLALISAQFIIIGVILRQHYLFLSHSKIQTVSLLIVFFALFCIICYYLATQGVKGNYVSLALFRSDFIGSYFASISGSLMVIFLSIIIKHNKILEWLGRQSLVIMCVHFPFCM